MRTPATADSPSVICPLVNNGCWRQAKRDGRPTACVLCACRLFQCWSCNASRVCDGEEEQISDSGLALGPRCHTGKVRKPSSEDGVFSPPVLTAHFGGFLQSESTKQSKHRQGETQAPPLPLGRRRGCRGESRRFFRQPIHPGHSTGSSVRDAVEGGGDCSSRPSGASRAFQPLLR